MRNKHLVSLKLFSNTPKHKTFIDMLNYEARQFCMNTALHGYRFIVLPKRVLLERAIWTTLVIVSLITAITLLSLAWISFQENPTFLVTDSTQFPIWNYPFPSVTVCDMNKLHKGRLLQLAQNLSNSLKGTGNLRNVDEIAKDLRLLFQLVNLKQLDVSYENYSRMQNILDLNNLQPVDVLKQLTPTCEETLQRCRWKGEDRRCETLFEMVSSTEGFCCSFNYFALKNHTFGGYLAHKAPTMPRRVAACGYQTGLEIMLQNYPKNYFLTQIPSIGHRILIHDSNHYPDSQSQSIITEMKLVQLIDVIPSITYSTSKLRELDIKKRNCLLSHERNLLMYNGYTRHNCMKECRMNLTREYCNCIPVIFFYMKAIYPGVRLCNLKDVFCLLKYQSMINSAVPGFNFNNIPRDHVYGTEKDKCSCMPDCDYVTYDGEATSLKLNNSGGIKVENQSIVRVFFDDMVATRNRRDVTFTWQTLLAYYGGLLSLFIGFSFVSIIEIFYFFTIRLIADSIVSSKMTRTNQNTTKLSKHKIQVKPMEALDPHKLMIPKQIEGIRHRTNSNPGFYN